MIDPNYVIEMQNKSFANSIVYTCDLNDADRGIAPLAEHSTMKRIFKEYSMFFCNACVLITHPVI